MSDLTTLLGQLDILKQSINLESVSTCICCNNVCTTHGLSDLNTSLTVPMIEGIINCGYACSHCANMRALNSQFETLKNQIKIKICSDYSIDPMMNPFK